MKYILALIAFVLLVGAFYALTTVMGAGALKRHITMSGIYSVCKPQGYPVVCFLDADGKDGGMFCLPLQTIGGVCH